MRKKVEEAEAKVEDFPRQVQSVWSAPTTPRCRRRRWATSMPSLLPRASQKADAEAKAKMIREMLRSGQPIESSDILNSELIRRLAEQRVTLRAQLAEQSATLLDNHPRIIELKAQIADLNNQIRAEAETIARSFENDAKLAGARVDTLTASLDQLKSQAATTNGARRAIARARARRQIAARSVGVVSRQISRGDVARHAWIRRPPTRAWSRAPRCRTFRPIRRSCRRS